MKKFLVALSLICFVAVNVSNAQTQASATTKEVKKEAVEAKSSDATMSGCHQAKAKSCCKKSSMKACTPEEKAKCEAEKAKADAADVKGGTK